MEKEGTKRIELAGKEDKRQLTAVLVGSMSGDFLPPQIIYQGKQIAVFHMLSSQLDGMLHIQPIIGVMKLP